MGTSGHLKEQHNQIASISNRISINICATPSIAKESASLTGPPSSIETVIHEASCTCTFRPSSGGPEASRSVPITLVLIVADITWKSSHPNYSNIMREILTFSTFKDKKPETEPRDLPRTLRLVHIGAEIHTPFSPTLKSVAFPLYRLQQNPNVGNEIKVFMLGTLFLRFLTWNIRDGFGD